MTSEADRLITAPLRDHARVAAPPHLHAKLARRYARARRPWAGYGAAMALGAALAIAAMLVVRPAPAGSPTLDVAREAVGDHLRIVSGRGLAVESNDFHNVKPWFAGKLDFTPPVTFLGDDEFPLRGGDVAIFFGHKAAAFVYGHRLHVLSLFVYEPAADATTDESERTLAGYHVLTWTAGGFGYALVSDINVSDLHALASRLRR